MQIKVNYYSLEPRIFIAGTKNSYGFERLEFEFSEEWDGLEKTVTFYPVDASPVSVILTENSVLIPHEVMVHAGRASFTVSGYRENLTLVTVNGYLDVLDANDPVADLAESPTESQISQLLAIANEAARVAQSVRDDADSGKLGGTGIVAGGKKGQFLTKKSADNYDTEWSSPITLYRDEIADLWEELDEPEVEAYPYACDVSAPATTVNSCVDVYFYGEDAAAGKLAPYCDTGNGYVRLYAKEDLGYIEVALIKVVNV